MMSPIGAANAYAAVQKSMGAEIGGIGGQAVAPTGGFGDMLKNVMGEAIEASRSAETKMVQQVQGRADLVDVVTAISAAESKLETVMAVRDQVISAYQEIMRMPI